MPRPLVPWRAGNVAHSHCGLGGRPIAAEPGLPRILRLLDKHQLPASFFIPAVRAALRPEMIKQVLTSKRHEIGVHGWIPERLPLLNDEKSAGCSSSPSNF